MRYPAPKLLILGILATILSQGCAHRRQSYYPEDFQSGRGVSVRAPFVNVQVRGKQRLENEPKLVGYDDNLENRKKIRRDDDDDDRD